MPSISHVTSTQSEPPHVNGNGYIAKINNYTNGESELSEHLPKPKQDVLLLNGPGQKYTLHTTGQIPELESEREILIQVRNESGYAALN